ncbi:hypothetical protein P0136_10500 [Lentisphaerota bacterium ZTH]|nr:hypothetical protein JYG24_11990 [Lentisphaerota bacterium]WET05791.1 hypothetical protein P0136_10500 [Lentisphaerota bacterium ZTH]
MKHIIAVFCIVFFCIQSLWAADVLFLAYDFGDGNSFKEVQTALEQNNISCEVIGLGKALGIFNSSNNLVHRHLKELSNFNNKDFVDSREHLLSQHNLTALTTGLEPKIIITGMSSAALAQIANSFDGSYKIAYYDNFDLLENSTYTLPFLQKVQQLNAFFITSSKLKASFKNEAEKFDTGIIVAGAPALNIWKKIYADAIPSQVREKLGIPSEAPVVVFAGDTTDDYGQYFKEFVKAMTKLPNITAVVTYHPKTDGSFERSVVKSFNAKNVIIAKPGTNTIELSTISRVFVVHKSSMGAQSLSVGKNVIFVASENYKNLFVKNGLAQLATNAEQLHECILKAFKASTPASLTDYGVPNNPDHIFVSQIQLILKQTAE